MSTLKQQEANRLNAQKSTGPRTLAGKAVSRFNALKSGIDAEAETLNLPLQLASFRTHPCSPLRANLWGRRFRLPFPPRNHPNPPRSPEPVLIVKAEP
jgi:hypothetical protein